MSASLFPQVLFNDFLATLPQEHDSVDTIDICEIDQLVIDVRMTTLPMLNIQGIIV